ncbi:MAG: LysR substrate-binding domain-containing protein [Alphaproteobacteria bacterium]
MNLRDFQYFVALAEHRHFGRAAEACNVSQPTLSMQIQKLEAYLGTQLLERQGRQLLLTPTGEDILAHAQAIMHETKTIRDIARFAQNPLAGEFRLGAFPTLAPYMLPHIVPRIHKALPELKLLLTEEKTDKLLEKLSAGELDAALLALPAGDSGMESKILFEDPFLLAVPKHHKLATRKWVTVSDITNEPLLLLEDGHCLRAQALEFCRAPNVSEYKEFRATSLETLRQMVVAGVGITLIPETARQKKDGLIYIPFRDKKVARSIGLVWRKSTSRGEVIQSIIRITCNSAIAGG